MFTLVLPPRFLAIRPPVTPGTLFGYPSPEKTFPPSLRFARPPFFMADCMSRSALSMSRPFSFSQVSRIEIVRPPDFKPLSDCCLSCFLSKSDFSHFSSDMPCFLASFLSCFRSVLECSHSIADTLPPFLRGKPDGPTIDVGTVILRFRIMSGAAGPANIAPPPPCFLARPPDLRCAS